MQLCVNDFNSIKSRFLTKISKHCIVTDCWIWIGNKNNCGYGRLSIGPRTSRKMVLAHRISYMLYIENDLEDGMVIAHKCDNPMCVNPKHLFKCTQQENMIDKINKGRHLPKGGW